MSTAAQVIHDRPALGAVVQLRERPFPVELGAHPRGEEGIRKAMAWMVERIVADARHPLVIEWARQAVSAAGADRPRGYYNPDTVAAAIAARLERETVFVDDPIDTEAIGSTVQVLCLDPEGDLCLRGGDCDELVRALASCLLAVGIPVRLQLRFYPKRRLAHIVVQYDSDRAKRGQWACWDPSVKGGRCSAEPFSGEIVMEVVMGTMNQPGTFVGMGGPPDAAGAMGDPPTDLSASDVSAWLQIITGVKNELDASVAGLQKSRSAYLDFRNALGLPQYDAATQPGVTGTEGTTTGPQGSGPLATYFQTHQWTAATDTAEQQLISAAQFCSQVLGGGLSGARAMYWNAGDVLIAQATGDPYRLALVSDATTGAKSVQFLDANGQTTGTMGALGTLDILIGGAIVAAVTVACAWAVKHYCDYQRSAHHDDALERIASKEQDLVAAGKETPADKQAMMNAATNFAAAGPPPTDTLGTASTVLAVVISAAAGAAAGYFAPRVLSSLRTAA